MPLGPEPSTILKRIPDAGAGGCTTNVDIAVHVIFFILAGGHAWICSRLYRAVGTTRNLFSPAAAAFRMLHGATIGLGIAVGYMRDFSSLQSCIGSIPGFTKLYQATFDKCVFATSHAHVTS